MGSRRLSRFSGHSRAAHLRPDSRVDLSSLFVDASLPDGSRLHVVIPDITILGLRDLVVERPNRS